MTPDEINVLLCQAGISLDDLLKAHDLEKMTRERVELSLGMDRSARSVLSLSDEEKHALVPIMTKAFVAYCHEAWSILNPSRPLSWNWHLDHICQLLVECSLRLHRRAIINVPPRTSKSSIVNVLYPTWRWTWDAGHQFNNYSHSEKLAVRDSLACRRLVTSEWYQARWGDRVVLTGDQSAKAFYQTEMGGHRAAFGISSNITGAGADTQILDDLLDAKASNSEADRHSVIETLDEVLPSRFNEFKDGVMILIMQRLHEDDPAGHLKKKWDEEGLSYAILCYPMEYDPAHPWACVDDVRSTPGELLWSERFDEEAIRELRATSTEYAWAGQYQQRPAPRGGGILKTKFWRLWEERDGDGRLLLPNFKFLLQSYDTAFTAATDNLKTGKAAYSARTTWGVFEHRGADHMMLIEAWRDHVDYPALRREVKQAYSDMKPDAVLIEKKASGISLIQDLRQADIPILDYTPDRDKVSRAHSASAYLEAGKMWYPPRKWADKFINACASFPAGDGADWVDTMTQAVIRIRNMHFVQHPEDDWEDAPPVERVSLYG